MASRQDPIAGGVQNSQEIKWTKIAKIASGIKSKDEPLHHSSSKIVVEKSKIAKKIAHPEKTEEKAFLPSIVYPNFTTVDLYRFLCNKCARWRGYTLYTQTYYYFGTSVNY